MEKDSEIEDTQGRKIHFRSLYAYIYKDNYEEDWCVWTKQICVINNDLFLFMYIYNISQNVVCYNKLLHFNNLVNATRGRLVIYSKGRQKWMRTLTLMNIWI